MEKKIETNEIVYNNLPIEDFEQLGYSIFQDEYSIGNEDRANECIKYLLDNLIKTQDLLENITDILDEDMGMEKLEDKLKEIDTYQLGDLINFIETIKIVPKNETYVEKMKRLAKEDYNDFINLIDNDNNYFYDEKEENNHLYIEVYYQDGRMGLREQEFIMSAEYEYDEEEDEYKYIGE